MLGRIGDEGSVDVVVELALRAICNSGILHVRNADVVEGSLEVRSPVLADIVTIGRDELNTLHCISNGSSEEDINIDGRSLGIVVPGDDRNFLTGEIPEISRGNCPLDDMGTLTRRDDDVLDSTKSEVNFLALSILNLHSRHSLEGIVGSVELILADTFHVIDKLVHILDSGPESIAFATEAEDVLTLRIDLAAVLADRDKFIGRIILNLLGDEDLDVSDLDDILTVHELDTDDRSTADSSSTSGFESPRSEDTAIESYKLILRSDRSSDLVVLDNLIDEGKASSLHVSSSHLGALSSDCGVFTNDLDALEVGSGDVLEIDRAVISNCGIASSVNLIK